MTKPRSPRRKLSVSNSHEMHRNPFSDIGMAMEWAHVHHLLCEKCRNRKTRNPHSALYPVVWAENYNHPEGE